MLEIRMQGPAKNALGSDMLRFVLDRIGAAKGAPILLTGTGDAFSAGLDLKEVASQDAAGMDRYLRLLERCMAALFLYPAPVVALVNGHAIAGGAVLAACCDHRVAVDDARARIGLNEVALGVIFPPRVLRIVRERIPRAHHEAVLLGAGLFPPREALGVGLVDEVSAAAPAAARARLAMLASHPAEAYAATKRAMRGEADADLASDGALDAWLRASIPVWTGEAVKAKIAAVLERSTARR
jgi:enoyl-CoA hydratase/carnithine racemase